MKYGIVPELAYVGLEATGRSILGEKPLNAIKKSIDTFTFGLTDFTSGIEAEKKELEQNMISPDKVSFIDRMSDNIAELMARHTPQDKAYWKKLTKKEAESWYMGGRDIVERGLADYVVDRNFSDFIRDLGPKSS